MTQHQLSNQFGQSSQPGTGQTLVIEQTQHKRQTFVTAISVQHQGSLSQDVQIQQEPVYADAHSMVKRNKVYTQYDTKLYAKLIISQCCACLELEHGKRNSMEHAVSRRCHSDSRSW